MDSISIEARARLDACGVRTLEYPSDKDKTDLELALDFALTVAAERITVMGALGGSRLDHTLGNVMLLSLPSLKAIDVRMLDQSGEALAVWESTDYRRRGGRLRVAHAADTRVTGVVTSGLKYALAGDTLIKAARAASATSLSTPRLPSAWIQGVCWFGTSAIDRHAHKSSVL